MLPPLSSSSSSPAVHILVHWVFPLTGSLLGFIMSIAPLRAVRRAEKAGELGALNPLPSCVFLLNCTAWLLYGAAVKDPFVFCANLPAIPVSLHLVLHYYSLACKQLKAQMERVLLFSSFLLLGVGSLYVFLSEPAVAIQINGAIAIAATLLLYASPLSTLSLVLRTHSAASIHLPFTIAALFCAFSWFFYGLATRQVLILIPHLIGVILNVVLLGLKAVYKEGEREGGRGGETDGEEEEEEEEEEEIGQEEEDEVEGGREGRRRRRVEEEGEEEKKERRKSTGSMEEGWPAFCHQLKDEEEGREKSTPFPSSLPFHAVSVTVLLPWQEEEEGEDERGRKGGREGGRLKPSGRPPRRMDSRTAILECEDCGDEEEGGREGGRWVEEEEEGAAPPPM